MLEVNSLTKRFGATVAVDGLSFKADPGRILGFLGPNGAGKTTTLRTLLGLTLPTSGSATVEGRSYRALAGAFGAGLGALLRNQVVAVGLVLVFLFVVDPTLVALVDGYDRFSLSGLQTSITGGSAEDFGGDELLPVWAATLIWTGYTAVLVGAAALLTSRCDI